MPNKSWQGDNWEFRRKFQKCFVERSTGDVVLRLHETDIVRVRPNGDVILSTGGWATHKTMTSMNDALSMFDMWVECASGGIPQGYWQVADSDGTLHPYNNDRDNYVITIRARTADAKDRAKILASCYELDYNPPSTAPRVAAAAAPRAAAAATGLPPQGPRIVAAQPAAARANGLASAATAAPPPAALPSTGGTWANIAKRGSPMQTSAAAGHAVRVTGPGAVGAAAASGRVTGPPGMTAAAAAAAQAPAGPRAAAAPPGFSSAGPSSSGSAAGGHMATVTSAPPVPVGVQLEQQMKKLGLDPAELEDDAHLCVVCMEEPRSIVLVPCGHMALCKDCCEEIIVKQQQNCPMCCQEVEYHVEVDQ